MNTKSELYQTGKPQDCAFISSYGIDYLNVLLQKIVEQKRYSMKHAPGQMQTWREKELAVRKCIKVAQFFARQL